MRVIVGRVHEQGEHAGPVGHGGPHLTLFLEQVVSGEKLLDPQGVDLRPPEPVPQVVLGALALQSEAVLAVRLEDVLVRQRTTANLNKAISQYNVLSFFLQIRTDPLKLLCHGHTL